MYLNSHKCLLNSSFYYHHSVQAFLGPDEASLGHLIASLPAEQQTNEAKPFWTSSLGEMQILTHLYHCTFSVHLNYVQNACLLDVGNTYNGVLLGDQKE